MKREQKRWHSPPKAEARGSNPFGCAIFSITFKVRVGPDPARSVAPPVLAAMAEQGA